MVCFLELLKRKVEGKAEREMGNEASAETEIIAQMFFFFFFFTQVQTPVTLCSGELWSILVVRLAHSADLRSWLRHECPSRESNLVNNCKCPSRESNLVPSANTADALPLSFHYRRRHQPVVQKKKFQLCLHFTIIGTSTCCVHLCECVLK